MLDLEVTAAQASLLARVQAVCDAPHISAGASGQ